MEDVKRAVLDSPEPGIGMLYVDDGEHVRAVYLDEAKFIKLYNFDLVVFSPSFAFEGKLHEPPDVETITLKPGEVLRSKEESIPTTPFEVENATRDPLVVKLTRAAIVGSLKSGEIDLKDWRKR